MMKPMISLGMICTLDTDSSSVCLTIASIGFERVAFLHY